MTEDVFEQLLQLSPAQLAGMAVAALSRQGELVATVIETVKEQLSEFTGLSTIERIYLAGCGDSYFAALSARYAFERFTGCPTVALEAIELAHYTLPPPNSLVVVISSSGEASATLEAGTAARLAGASVVGITAGTRCCLADEFPCLTVTQGLVGGSRTDQTALILGNFSFSLVTLYLLAVEVGRRLGRLNDTRAKVGWAWIGETARAIERAAGCSAEIGEYLGTVSEDADLYFLGAGPNYGVALFYQAKFFEQAQRPVYGVHLEEFAHEQFFLLRPDRDAHVWFIAPRGHSRQRALRLMDGCREMGARVVAVGSAGDEVMRGGCDLFVPVAPGPEMFSPLPAVVPGELLGICAFRRWGDRLLAGSERRRQMALARRLTRRQAAVGGRAFAAHRL